MFDWHGISVAQPVAVAVTGGAAIGPDEVVTTEVEAAGAIDQDEAVTGAGVAVTPAATTYVVTQAVEEAQVGWYITLQVF